MSTANSPTTPTMHHRFRLQLISPFTVVIYCIAGVVLLALPPQNNLFKLLIGLTFITVALLRSSNRILPWSQTSYVQLHPNQLEIRRAPFGLHRTSYSYRGFLRVFALPASAQLILVFDKSHYKRQVGSTLAMQTPTEETILNEFVWVALPRPYQYTQFTTMLLQVIEESTVYKQANAQLHAVDVNEVLPLYMRAVQRSLPHKIWQQMLGLLRIARWSMGYNNIMTVALSQQAQVHRYPRQGTRSAIILCGISLTITAVSGVATQINEDNYDIWLSISILGALALSGPLVWLLLYTFSRQSGMIITPTASVMKQPLRFFDRRIPHAQLGGVSEVDIDKIALIWLKPRRQTQGDKQFPPRPTLLVSTSLESADACLTQILQLSKNQAMTWSTQEIISRKKRRTLVRRILLFLALPPFTFILILIIYRIYFALMML